MNVIGHRAIREFSMKHADARTPLDDWYRITRRSRWNNIVEVRSIFPTADAVGELTVFNIAGNKYRVVVKIDYDSHLILMKHVLTHAEYDKGAWKK